MPFLLGILIVPVGLWLRATLEETHADADDPAIRELKLPPIAGLLAGGLAGLVTLLGSPLGGALSDRIGRKPVIGTAYLLIVLGIDPGFLLLDASPSLPTLFGVVAVFGLLNAIGGATAILTQAEIFPVAVRATAMSLTYALGVAVVGGFGPFIVTWMIGATGDALAPSWYVLACGLVTLLSLPFVPEMRGKTLD